MASTVNPVWLHPVSVKPEHFVNRDEDVRKLRRILDSHLAYQSRDTRVLVTGDRGVGKSIFCRAVVQGFARAHPDKVIPVTVDGRGIGQREFLEAVALHLVEGARAALARLPSFPEGLDAWLQQLTEMATNHRITRRATQTTGREVGAGAEVGGSLFGLLTAKGSLAWKHRREQGQVQELILDVTEPVLRAAAKATLERLADLGWIVVVLFDDLDQARDVENAESGKAALKALVDLAPCIQVVHLRNEAVHRDIRRERSELVELQALQPDGLEKILRRRLEGALPADQAVFKGGDGGWEPLRRLMAVTGNPYVLLRWAHALMFQYDWPPPPEWSSRAGLLRLAREAGTATGVADGLLERLGAVVDRCAAPGNPQVQRADLLRGALKTDTGSPGARLSEAELAMLEKVEILLPVDRFDPQGPLRLDPALTLLLPSVGERLRAG